VALTNAGAEVDPVAAWEGFHQAILVPLVAELGARTWELLNQEPAADAPVNFVSAVGHALDARDEAFKRAVVAFLDPSDADIRAFVLRVLNAYFFAQASSLSSETL